MSDQSIWIYYWKSVWELIISHFDDKDLLSDFLFWTTFLTLVEDDYF